MEPIKSYVKRRVWDHDDEYFTVEVQVDGSEFKAGDKVLVTVEKAPDNKHEE